MLEVVTSDSFENEVGKIIEQRDDPGEMVIEARASSLKVKFTEESPLPWHSSQSSGTLISFEKNKVFNTHASPSSGNIAFDLEGAKLGVVQKLYHQAATVPQLPAIAVRLGVIEYEANALNIIYFEYCAPDRIEYWIQNP